MADQPVPVTTRLTLLSRVAYRDREIAGARLRGLLALLAGDLRTGCSSPRLMEGLWPDEQPENPAKALQVLVSRARAQLGSELIISTPTGYRLSLREDQVDTSAVLLSASASARHSRAGDEAAALAHAEAGLALWEGTAGGDTAFDDPVSALRAERAATYRALLRARALALSRLGRHAEAAEALTDLVAERPRDEEVLLELLRCEAATVGPSAALARYEAYRLATLIEDTAWILSHFRPDPDLVEVTRTATTLSAIYTFLIPGPRRLRPLVTLRRLPPGPPNTVIRALAKVLSIAPEFLGSDPSALEALCESDEPVLAGIANGFASFLWENEGDLDSALKAARRILGPFENQETQTPWMRVLAHSRISELCMRVDQGDEAQRHLKAALGVQEEFGERSDAFGIRWDRGGPGGHRGRPCAPRPARPRRAAHRRTAAQAVGDSHQSHRHAVAIRLRAPRLRRAPAGAGHGGPRPRTAQRRRASHEVGRADGRPGGALPFPSELSADHVRRARPPRGRARRQVGIRRRGVDVYRPGSRGAASRGPDGAAGARALMCRIAVEQCLRPEVSGQCDAGAPGEGDHRVVSDRGAHQQSPQRLDDRGEGLVFGEPAQPGRHGVGGDEPAAEERQEHQGRGKAARALDALGHHAERDRQPDECEAEHREDTDRRDPLDQAGGGPEADQQRDTDDDRRAEHRLDQAADDVAGQHRDAGDGHGAEPGDDAFGHVHGDRDRRPGEGCGQGHKEDSGSDVVGVVGAAA